ncbi:MAG: hypothetical protein NVSMB16_17230 [Acidimicrobiales bacterium]
MSNSASVTFANDAHAPLALAERRSLRFAGAVLLVGDAAIHVKEATGATDTPRLAVAFSASALGMLVGAALLMTVAHSWGWLVGGAGTALATLLAYCLTRSVGLPLIDPSADIGNWTETLGVVSLLL